MSKAKLIFSQNPTRYAWLILLLSACFLFYKYILQISPSVMSHELMSSYSLTGTGLGFLVGFYFYTYMIMQIPSGILLDKYGPHRLTSLAIFLCATGILIFSQTHSLGLACFARLLIGFGAAFATTSYMKLSSQWFPPRYFPLLSGLFGTACMTGAGTAEAPLAWMVSDMGWRDTLFSCALVGFVLVFLFWFLVRDKVDAPTKSGSETSFSFNALLNLFKSSSNWALIFYGGLAFTPASVFGGLWGVPFLVTAYPISKSVAAASVSLAFFGFAVGGIVIGLLGRFCERQLPLMRGGSFLSLVFLSLVLYVPHLPLWMLNTCIFMFGLCSSGFLLSYAVAKSTNPAALVATVIGVINMGDPLCGAIAEPLIGKILDLNWAGAMHEHVRAFSLHAYHLGLSVLTVFLALAVVSCFFIKENRSASSTHR